MATLKRTKSKRPESVEELLKIRNKNQQKNKSSGNVGNSLSKIKKQPIKKRSATTDAVLGKAKIEKPRKLSPKEQERKMLGLDPLEDEMQMCIIDWAKQQSWKGRKIDDYLHHSPNGGKRSKLEAYQFKQMGTKAGFPDLFLIVPVEPFHGLFIELKTAKGTVSATQKAYHPRLIEQGYRVETCYSIEGAINLIKSYLGIA